MQRKLGTPLWVVPARVTEAAPHRGHGGIGSDSGITWVIPSSYDRADQRATTPADRRLFAAARTALSARQRADGSIACVPSRRIPRGGRADDRLIAYGYRYYRELFNPRQLLHLSLLAEAIAGAEGLEQEALALAYSDHLATTCMLTYYAFGWRRLAPLFTVRAYRHVTRPVEVNPWADGTGRGTFPNAVRQVQRAAEFARSPTEPDLGGGFLPSNPLPADGGRATVLHADSRRLDGVGDRTVDLVLTNPPYFDNIAYSELSDFYLPWLRQFGLARATGGASLAARGNLAARAGRGPGEYAIALAACFEEVRRVLKDDGRMVFTFQHKRAEAWVTLASALRRAGFRALQVFPLLGRVR